MWAALASTCRTASSDGSSFQGRQAREDPFPCRDCPEAVQDACLSFQLPSNESPRELQADGIDGRQRLGSTEAGVVSPERSRSRNDPTVEVDLREPDPNIGHPSQSVECQVASVSQQDDPADLARGTSEPPLSALIPNPIADDELTATDEELDPEAIDDEHA